VLAIAGPMTLASITTPLLGIVGTAVIGRLGQAQLLGAVAISGIIFDCMFWLFAFLRMGTVALTAQALGARDVTEERAVLARALVIAAALGVVLIALQLPLGAVAYVLMGASAEVTSAAKVYFAIRIWSAPFALANFAILGWLVGLSRATSALLLQIVINLVNVAVTALLVLALDFGVAGAAIGALVAESFGTAAGIAMALRIVRGGTLTWAMVLDR
jgi:MATE family multidrug resistance protein